MSKRIVIAGGARTPMGAMQGDFKDTPAPDLGAIAIKAALVDAKVDPNGVGNVFMGCVLPAGMGQAPARQAAIAAGIPTACPSTTVNKMCGSGMATVILAHDQLMAGSHDIVVAGGMENMTLAPYISMKTRSGARMGHIEMKDHMFLDGLEDSFGSGELMGHFAERCAQKYQFTREDQDEYALRSLSNALAAQQDGVFEREIAPVTLTSRKGDTVVSEDEQPKTARPDKIPSLRPAFKKDGTVTAANASSISDGAAALVMTTQEHADATGLGIRARILGHATHAQDPEWFTTAPVPAAQKLLAHIAWDVGDVDLWEINEAFAVVPMAFMQELGLSRDIVNVHGGACALGHPVGASGARIIVSLINAMERQDAKRGIAAICIGGGEGMAVAIERD